MSKHPVFKAVQKKIANKQGVSQKAAGAILAASTRKASAAAKEKEPQSEESKVMAVPHKCPKCDGYGQLPYDPNNPFGSATTVAGPWGCPPCNGTGVISSTDPLIVCKPFRTGEIDDGWSKSS